MKRAKATFIQPEDGLGEPIRLPDSLIEELRAIVNSDKESIEKDYIEQISRIDMFLKREVGAIPRNQDFVNWFYDNKKFGQWGAKLPKITDKQIIDYAKQYVEELKKAAKKNTPIADLGFFSFRLLKDIEYLEKLREKLVPKFVSPNTTFDAFLEVFTAKPLKDIKNRIEWQQEAKNGSVNKRGVFDLITCLEKNEIIEVVSNRKSVLLKVLSFCFCENKRKMKFTNSNLIHSTDFKDIEAIVKDIK